MLPGMSDRPAMPENNLLSEQVAYYRARAPEYDEWMQRIGRYSRGGEADRRWFEEFSIEQQRLRDFKATGDVLEIACGTGLSTAVLAESATSLVALDAAPEMIGECRKRPGLEEVEFVLADVFSWRTDRSFDAVVFTFWLSHVPEELFETFWTRIRVLLKPHGRVFFADNLYAPWATAIDHELKGPEEGVVVRKLNDGREFRVVKRFLEPAVLQAELGLLGWDIVVEATGDLLLTGQGRLGAVD